MFWIVCPANNFFKKAFIEEPSANRSCRIWTIHRTGGREEPTQGTALIICHFIRSRQHKCHICSSREQLQKLPDSKKQSVCGGIHTYTHTQNIPRAFFGNYCHSGRYFRIRTNSKGRNKTLMQIARAQPVISRVSLGPAPTSQYSAEGKSHLRQLWLLSCQKTKK